jgi:NCS1 family nucleobase:cation symporter-1
VNDLCQYEGQYTYRQGFDPTALLALVLRVVPCVPGFLAAIGAVDKTAVWPWLLALYNYAWFVGFFVVGALYLVLMRGKMSPAR